MPAPKKTDLIEANLFAVTLNKPVQIGRKLVHPGSNPVIRGDILAGIIDADKDAVKDYAAVTQ